MSKAILVLAAFLAVLGVGVRGQVPTKPTFVGATCETAFGNYTTREYDLSLLNVLVDLVRQANSSFVFSSTSNGTAPDKVFGQYYCRGDIPSSLCGECVERAALLALARCPNAKAAVVFYRECSLHYQNQPLLGVELERPGWIWASLSNVTDPGRFFTVANNTMSGLVMEAATGTAKFATGEGVVSATETVHCLVQCSPDMNATQCDSCLHSAAEAVRSCCGQWPSGLYVFLPSCQMMYNTLAGFYYTPNAGAPPASPSAPPSSLNSARIMPIP